MAKGIAPKRTVPKRMARGRSFKAENRAFEQWLAGRCTVVRQDLKKKHEKMKDDPFTFLRATYFRWARRIETLCPTLARAPAVLSVGDSHLENFGTWRDAEGRLVWGVNDFDEAAVMPYPFDLVRLVASACLAPGLDLSAHDIAAAVLKGYRRALAEPHPTLLDEKERWMRPYVACSDEERAKFWSDIDDLPAVEPPRAVQRGLKKSLPKHARITRYATRVKGSGSLGRPRFIADAVWRGGRVVREAKALVPSAWTWAHGGGTDKPQFTALFTGRYRSPDPWLTVHNGTLFRRIDPDSRKVELDAKAQGKLTPRLLTAMGFDLGAIHAAAKRKRVAAIARDLEARPASWLAAAGADAAADVERDYKEWTR